jgi:RsiW-degrading membrane proteinase PrsW (M82 family)
MNQIIQIFGSTLLALVPVTIWGYIFFSREKGKRQQIAFTFLLGMIAVLPIIFYKSLWNVFPWMNAYTFANQFSDNIITVSNVISIPLSIIVTFMIVGIIEEVMKLFAVKIGDSDQICDIDDSIEYFIVAALGFSFIENVLYFYNIWFIEGVDNLIMPFIFRSTFSTFAHLLFSGVLGYFYGVAYFARPILQEEIRKNRKHWTVYFHKIFAIRKDKLFHQEKLMEGLIISIALHALFNIFLELQLTFMLVPYLIVGYYTLTYLLNKKENHKKYGLLLNKGHRNHNCSCEPASQ